MKKNKDIRPAGITAKPVVVAMKSAVRNYSFDNKIKEMRYVVACFPQMAGIQGYYLAMCINNSGSFISIVVMHGILDRRRQRLRRPD